MIVKEWILNKEDRLDLFLRGKLKELFKEEELSNSKIRRLIIAGSVFVNGRQCRIPSYQLFPSSKVKVSIDKEKLFYQKENADIDFTLSAKDILYEDDFLIIVNKPAFLPTEETFLEGRKNLHQCVVDYLWSKNPALKNPPYAGIMHRLDLETSGAILFTKSRSVNPQIHKIFEERKIKKVYTAVSFAQGKLSPLVKETFTYEAYIKRISKKSQACKMGICKKDDSDSLFSSTDFKILSKDKDGFYYIQATLNTGRTHQIRVHLSSLGLAIVGDQLYGSQKYFLDNKKRIMLHSTLLEFAHPVSGNLLKITAPLPPHFKNQAERADQGDF